MTTTPDTPTPDTPTLTGRRLVELLICTGPAMVSAREFVGATPAPGTPSLDAFYQRGDILPPGLKADFAAHLIRVGLVTPVTVRI